MHAKRTFTLVFFVVLTSITGFAQPANNKWSISGELLLPSGRTNAPFRSYLNGLINAQPKLTYTFSNNLFISAGFKYMYYTIAEFKVPEKMNGGMHVAGTNLELGYTRWATKNFGIDFGMKVGVGNYMFRTDSTASRGQQQLTAMYYEPNVQFILLADEAVAYRWIVGYNIAGFDFQSRDIGLTTNGGFKLSDYNKSTQTFLVGFGITIYLGNKRTDTDILEIGE